MGDTRTRRGASSINSTTARRLRRSESVFDPRQAGSGKRPSPIGREGVIDGVRSVWLKGPDGKPFRPTPRQIDFFRALKNYPRVCFVGGAGAGKTTAIAAALILLMLKYPGTDWLVGRLNYRGLVAVTWRVIRQMCPQEVVLHASDSQQNLVLALKNGSVLYGWNLAQWERFQGLNLAGAVVDEQTELPDRSIYDALELRIRDPRGPRILFGACMPNGRDWTWQLYFRDCPEGHLGIRAKTADNPNLPPDYEAGLRKRFSAEQQARFLDAEFTSLSGLVLYPWDEQIHVIDPFPIPDHWPKYRALDPGWHQDPAACLFAAMDELGNLYLYDEYYETGRVIREQAATILTRGYPASFQWTAIDPSAVKRTETEGRALIDLYGEAGLHCVEAPRARVETGIEAVLSLLRPDPEHYHPVTGREFAPRLYVFRTMRHFIDEIEGWTYDLRGNPRTKNEHLMSCLRYLVLRRPHPAARPSTRPKSEVWTRFLEWGEGDLVSPDLPYIA